MFVNILLKKQEGRGKVVKSLSYKMNLEHRVPLLREEMFPMNLHLVPLVLLVMVFLKNRCLP